MRTNTDYIIVHCSDTYPAQDIGVDEIRRWHMDKGWRDVGYHFVIRRDGTVENGRDLDDIGAHARGVNRASVGICLVGGKSRLRGADSNFTRAQFKALERLLDSMHRQYPGATVLGHRDLPGVAKACPCFDVPAWWRNR